MNPINYGKYFPMAGLVLSLFIIPHASYSQCGAAPVAAAACTGGNGAATDGVNINSGNTYWFSGGPSTFSSINLNGGTLRICGQLTLGSLNFNSGNLIIEGGGSLTTAGMSSMNGSSVIINRGSLTISGGFTMQNSNNYIYNDLTTSTMTVSGTITVNGTSSYIINRGIMTVAGLYLQGPAGAVCEQNNSITNIGALTNETLNSITYAGNGTPSCFNVTGSAKLDADLTGFSQIGVCKGSAVVMSGGALVHTGGGWGSAYVHTGCSSCGTILGLGFSSFSAVEQGRGILLQWTTNGELRGDETFFVERSVDGAVFNTLTTVLSSAGRYAYSLYDAAVEGPKISYRIRALERGGASVYSPVALVEPVPAGQFLIYPNPLRPDNTINIVIHSAVTETAHLSLLDMTGKVLLSMTAPLVSGSNQLSWNPGGLGEGVYTVKIISSAMGSRYGRIVVLGGQ